jgi:hypothetical protein
VIRLGRSVRHLPETVNTLAERGVGFRSLTEGIENLAPRPRPMIHRALHARHPFGRNGGPCDRMRSRASLKGPFLLLEGRLGRSVLHRLCLSWYLVLEVRRRQRAGVKRARW